MTGNMALRIHIIEPHPDDALGSAPALCFCPGAEVVIHTIAGGGPDRDAINLAIRPECRKYVKNHRKYFLADYDWDLRIKEQIPYEQILEVYRREYGDGQLERLSEVLHKIIAEVWKEKAHLAIPLGIMHPMHMLVSSMAIELIKRRKINPGKLWIYVDHPYDLHSMGTSLMKQSVSYAEKELGYCMDRFDAVGTDLYAAGEILRRIYKNRYHAEFDGAFNKTLCGFYLPEKISREQKNMVRLQKIKILMIAAQGYPFIKGGGMANVVYGLSRSLQNFAGDTRILLPWYDRIPADGTFLKRMEFSHCLPDNSQVECILESREYQGIIYYFLKIPGVLKDDRNPLSYAAFAEIVLGKALPMLDYVPDILHCHDWQSAMIPFLLKTRYKKEPLYRKIKSLYTIHFYGYQGRLRGKELRYFLDFPDDRKTDRVFSKLQFLTAEAKKMLGVQQPSLISFMNAGIYFADVVSTVSEGYAEEISDYPAFKKGPEVVGIRNSILYDVYNPLTDTNLSINYGPENFEGQKAEIKVQFQRCAGLEENKAILLICMVCRLETVKGMDSVIEILPELLKLPLQMVIMGDEGREGYYSHSLERIRQQFPLKFVHFPFQREKETELYAASDVILVPSLSESCGTAQLIAMHYGVVPVVSCLASLRDSITPLSKEKMDKGVGYLTYPDDGAMLYEAILMVLQDFGDRKKWSYMVWKCMVTDFSWQGAAMKKYMTLYHGIISGIPEKK
ncbi:MAG: glycogen/starch synthase [Eubacteriales bacterium]|nr:glycogen/starch synthase [Eubacteriales bacterium]